MWNLGSSGVTAAHRYPSGGVTTKRCFHQNGFIQNLIEKHALPAQHSERRFCNPNFVNYDRFQQPPSRHLEQSRFCLQNNCKQHLSCPNLNSECCDFSNSDNLKETETYSSQEIKNSEGQEIHSKESKKLTSEMCSKSRKRTRRNRRNRKSKQHNQKQEYAFGVSKMSPSKLCLDSMQIDSVDAVDGCPVINDTSASILTNDGPRTETDSGLPERNCRLFDFIKYTFSSSPETLKNGGTNPPEAVKGRTNAWRCRQLSTTESEDSFIVFDSGTEDECDFTDETSENEKSDDSSGEENCDEDDLGSSSSSAISIKKVRFAEENKLCEIHPMVHWSFAYQAARKGHWETYVRDRDRFKKKISNIESLIGGVLKPEHRDRVYRQRFEGETKN